MPLFVFISGYFSNIKSVNYKQGIVRLSETFLVVQIIRTFIEGGYSFMGWLTPRMALWYILSLVYWKVFLFITPEKLLLKHKIIFFISLFLSFVMGVVPLTTLLSFQRTFTFLPFFILGFIMRDFDIKKILTRVQIYQVALFLLLVFCIYFFIGKSFLNELAGTHNIYMLGGVKYIGNRIHILILGTLMAIAIMRLTVLLTRFNCISVLGSHSIYIYHVFLYVYLFKPMVGSGMLSDSYYWIITYTFITLLILYLTSSWRGLNFVLNPFSNLIQLWKTRF